MDDPASELFDLIDADKDGSVSKLDLVDFCTSMVPPVNSAKLQKALGIESNGDRVQRATFLEKHAAGELALLNGNLDAMRLSRRNSSSTKQMGNVRSNDAGGHKDFDPWAGKDAGDEPSENGACEIYATANFLSAVLKSVHHVDLDAAATALILIMVHDKLNAEDAMLDEVPSKPAAIWGCTLSLPRLVRYCCEIGQGFPLVDGGSVCFDLQTEEKFSPLDEENEEFDPGWRGMEASDLTPGDILTVQMTPEAWEDHYGEVQEFPGLAKDKIRWHCVMFAKGDESGAITIRNSWNGTKRTTVPMDGVFERVDGKTTYSVSRVVVQPAQRTRHGRGRPRP